MPKRHAAAVLVLAILLPLAATGCTRTYDGTMVPTYGVVMSPEGGGAEMALTRSDPLPRSRFYKFPPAPPSPQPAASPAATRRIVPPRFGPLLPRIKAEAPRPVTCRNESRDGRIRLVCD